MHAGDAMDISKDLQTERISLGPVAFRDLTFFLRLVGNTSVRQFLGGPMPWRQRVRQFRAYRQGHPNVGIWIVRPLARQQAMGLLVLSPHKDGADYEISYQFHPVFWGNGFATEATARIVDHALNDLRLPRVIAETQTANAASCRLLSRLGFAEEKRLNRFGAEQAIFVRAA
jgi:ribosomal-protein-alanine N-acetyltransferase